MTTPTIGVAHINTVRNANLMDLMALLNEQQARTLDMVVPAAKLRFVDGLLVISDQEMILEDDGFVDPNGRYWPSQQFDDQLADRLDITTAYLRRLRHGKLDKQGTTLVVPRLDLWDANTNGLLQGRRAELERLGEIVPVTSALGQTTLSTSDDVTVDDQGIGWRTIREAIPADPRAFFLRLLRPENGVGIARAVLSDRFARMDNVDGLMAMLAGLTDAGVDPETLRIYGDLSETRMFVHVAAPQILAEAAGLLDGYRSPFDTEAEKSKRRGHQLSMEERIELGRQFRESGRGDGRHHGFYEPGNEPLVHAGFVLSNSEVGAGRWSISPEITVLRCSNGLTQTKDGFFRSHLGSRMDEGRVEWSADTQSKELALVTAQTRDVVKAVLSQSYLEEKVSELEGKAGKPVAEPERTIELVAKKFAFSKDEQAGILRHFLLGGSMTSGGVMNAVTSYSQTVDNPDAAHDLNVRAIDALEFAFAMK